MTTRASLHVHVLALSLAALGTFALMPAPSPREAPCERAEGQALEGLIDAGTAAAIGEWWLDAPATTSRLSFDPGHERLVWQVRGGSGAVVLDAETGEALGFEFGR